MRLSLLPLLAIGLAACWDWSFPPELLGDGSRPGDGRSDRPSDVPGSERTREARPTDAPAPDAAGDGPRVDRAVDRLTLDAQKPDDLKPDGPKADGPRPDLPKPDVAPQCGANCTGGGKKCVSGVCEVDCGASCACPAGEARCRLICDGANDCTSNVTCKASERCEVQCKKGACTNEVICQDGECQITCDGANTCQGAIRCTPARPCAIACSAGACKNEIWCNNACRCAVTCAPTSCTNTVHCLSPSCNVSPKGCTTSGGAACCSCPPC